MRTWKNITAASVLCGIALTGSALPAAASAAQPQPTVVSAAQPAPQAALTADKVVVRPGNTLVMRLNHGPEAVSWISSEAFVQNREHPAGAPEGVAQIVNDRAGKADAVATIADVPPGTYDIHTRVGGGNGPSMTITVVD